MSFSEYIKEERRNFPTSFDIVHSEFLSLKLHQESPDYFFKNASNIVELLRDRNWEEFKKRENEFSIKVLSSLIKDDFNSYNTSKEAITSYIEDNLENLYTLSLSNTQSRRSRAGGEFEVILSHILMGAEIHFEEQGLIGEGIFDSKQLAKLVDHVIPGSIEYDSNKRSTYAVSAKTTLRERWQQIGDEIRRTGMPEIYLATLDSKIPKNTLLQLSNNNIYPVTTENLKNEYYKNENSVITFEAFLEEIKIKSDYWSPDKYTDIERENRIERLKLAIENNSEYPYIKNYYEKWLSKFSTMKQ